MGGLVLVSWAVSVTALGQGRGPAAPPSAAACAGRVLLRGAVGRAGVVCTGRQPVPLRALVDAAGGARCAALPDGVRVRAGERVEVAGAEGAPCRVTVEPLSGLATLALGTRLDPNRASEADLQAVPGIGPVLARAIVASRVRDGAFRDVAALRRVRGIGEGRVATFGRYLEVRP